VLLQLAEEDEDRPESEASSRLTRDGVKAFVQDIVAGGTESSAVTIEWAMSELLRHPEAMAAATAELDRVVGSGRWVAERDLPDLPYVDAVVKETMRLHPVGPLLVPHHARQDTVVAGYDVPAGARVLVNVWAIARDPASWPDAPGAFRPERFLSGGSGAGVDVRGAHFELLPFGAGRRMCPAYGLAMKLVAAGVANLVHGFAWRLPDGMAPEDVSMEEQFGLSTRRKFPLVAVAEPRLPAHLYAAID
jgi:cytochrome P450